MSCRAVKTSDKMRTWLLQTGLRFACLFVLVLTKPHMTPNGEDAPSHYRLFRTGDVILGAIARLHRENQAGKCGYFYTPGLGRIEAMIYAVNTINSDDSILPNITLGLDIRDFCQDPVMAARHAYKFAVASNLNCACVRCTPDHQCTCVIGNVTSGACAMDAKSNISVTYPVAAIVGALTSSAAIPLANFLQAVKIPLIDSAATSEELSLPLYGNFFRTIPSDVNQAKAVADVIDTFQWRYVAAVAVDDSYGRHGVMALERESAARKTFCIERVGFIPLASYSDKLRSIVSYFVDRPTVRVIILWSHSYQGRDLLIEAARQGLTDRVWIFSEALAMVKPEFLPTTSGIASTGVHLGVQLPRKSNLTGFYQYLKSRLNQNTNTAHVWWKEFWHHVTSVSCSSTAQAQHCKEEKSTDELLDTMVDDFVPYIIDAINTTAHALDSIYRCNDTGEAQSCPQVEPTVRPADVARYVQEVDFEGVTGRIQLDQAGDPVDATYEVVYFDFQRVDERESSLRKILVGSWRKNRSERMIINRTMISWESRSNQPPVSTCLADCKPGEWKAITSNCCWKCLKCPDGSISQKQGAMNCTRCEIYQVSNGDGTECVDLEVVNIFWTDISAIILTLIILVGLALDAVAIYNFIRFRQTPIVKASNKVYSVVLLIGIALCFLLALLYIFKPSTTLCAFLKPARFVIYTLCCSALFLKTMQIVHAFNVSRIKNWIGVFICSTKRQVLVLLAILSIQLGLAVFWMLFDPPHVHMSVVPKKNVLFTCKPYKHMTGQALENMMLVYLLSMAGLCTFYAFRARNLPANFNEAKYISFSLYIFLLSWVVYQPIDYALEGWYVALLSAATILLSSYGLLGCIFTPKLYIMIQHPERNTAEFVRAELRNNTINKSCNNQSSMHSGTGV